MNVLNYREISTSGVTHIMSFRSSKQINRKVYYYDIEYVSYVLVFVTTFILAAGNGERARKDGQQQQR